MGPGGQEKVRLHFLGAASTVTGSKTLLKYRNCNILIDCGLFQGEKEKRNQNRAPLQIPAHEIQKVILTHAHLDHCGYIPKLVKDGFKGKIYCSSGTRELAEIILLDSAYLEEEQAAYAKKTQYSHHNPPIPLYTVEDAKNALEYFHVVERHEWVDLCENISLKLLNAGHIIGASMVQLRFTGDYESKVITFSGDMGHDQSLTMRCPEPPPETDILVLESTYGDRQHPTEDILESLATAINETVAKNGVVIIPAFAVGRSQEVLYMIRTLEASGKIKKIPVYLDSPMAEQATKTFMQHPEDQKVSTAFASAGPSLFPEKFQISKTPEFSMKLCEADGPFIVITASGMLTGGRVLHHLKARLAKEDNAVIFSGYQAEGTKGRYLQENNEPGSSLRIFHEETPVRASIYTLEALSSHADFAWLEGWLKQAKTPPSQIILNHGEQNSQEVFKKELEQFFKETDPSPEISTAYHQRQFSFDI